MTAIDSQLPPGFRFHPTDEELVVHYLCRKCTSQPIDVPIIAEIDLYKYAPWDLPSIWLCTAIRSGTSFLRGKGNTRTDLDLIGQPVMDTGRQPGRINRSDKPIGHPIIGIKKALVFYSGKAPKGEKTNWIMHEYCLAHVDHSPRSNNNVTPDEWVLCRIYRKKGTVEKQEVEDTKPVDLTPMPQSSAGVYDDFLCLDAPDSIPMMQIDQAIPDQRFVQPEIESGRNVMEWKRGDFNLPFDYMDAPGVPPMGGNEFCGSYEMEPMSSLFGYI